MELNNTLKLNKKFDEELNHILADPQYCLLYGSKKINPDKEDIKKIKENLYKEIYFGKSIFED